MLEYFRRKAIALPASTHGAGDYNLIGLVHLRRRELDSAAQRFQDAFVLFPEEGAEYRLLDRNPEALGFFRRAVAVHHELGDRWNEAEARDDLAAVLAEEEMTAARREWSQAHDLLTGFADQRAAALRARLDVRLRGRGPGNDD